jgi:hypothetical protein
VHVDGYICFTLPHSGLLSLVWFGVRCPTALYHTKAVRFS